MKKKTILIVIIALIVAAAGYVGYRLAIRGTDIIGVTTQPGKNTVYINGGDFESGSGYLTVGEGQKIHVKYAVESGSFDIFFHADEDAAATYETMDMENLPTAEQMTGEGAFGESGVTGKGEASFAAEPGLYTVYVTNHNMTGKATVTVK